MQITPPPSVAPTSSAQPATKATPDVPNEMSHEFEQLLWAELLVHTGLEKALTLGGGEGASMFSRYFVEAIAEDIAKQHPLGLLSGTQPEAPASDPTIGVKKP